jgi:A118 family predicted phage portal protein
VSIINAVFNNSVDSYRDAFKANDITSDWMKKAISDWFDLYFARVPTEKEDPCQQIPFTIVRKLTKAAFAEYKASGKDDFTQAVLDALDAKKQDAMQMTLIGGESLLKPILTKTGFRFAVVNRANLLVFGRDAEGNLTDIGTVETSAYDKHYYTLLERRTVDTNGYLTIRYSLYRSYTQGSLGENVGLQTLPQYADLPDVYTFPKPVWSIGMASFKTPIANCVDGGHDAVSVYAAAAGLIHNINRNEAQINGEFERGESRIMVSADMLRTQKDGTRKLDDNVFVGLDDDQETVGVTIFSPALREQSFLARKQEYLRNVENVIGLKRGLLSEVEAADRTATEITSSEGEYNLTIIDFQQMWERTMRQVVYLCGVLGQMYNVPGAHEVDPETVTIDWGNGVLYDENATWEDMKDQVSRGLLKPEIAVGWRYGMPYETPADLQKIREKYMPEVEELEDGE